MAIKKRQGLSREQVKAQTPEKIIDATIKTLVDEGLAGFSMNKVAKRAGIAQPSFYVHFENVDQLFEAVTEDAVNRYIEPIQKTITTVLQDIVPEKIEGVLDNLFLLGFDVIKDQQDLVRMIWAEREQTKSPFARHLRQVDEYLITSWGEVLIGIGLVDEKERDGMRLRLFMDGCLALVERYVTRWLDGEYKDEKQLAKVLTQYVLDYWKEEVQAFYKHRQ